MVGRCGVATAGRSVPGSWLEDLPRKARVDLLGLGVERRYEAGDVIIRFGAPSRQVHLVRQGRVKVVVPTEHGWQALLAVRGVGDVLGELAVLDGQPRSASVVALETVSTVEVPGARVLEFLRRRPEAMLVLLRTLSRRLRETDRRASQVGGRTVGSRLARRLLELAGSEGQPADDGVLIAVPLSHQDLADWIGASREAVSHALGRFRVPLRPGQGRACGPVMRSSCASTPPASRTSSV